MNTSEDQLRAELHDSLSAAGTHLPHVDAGALVDSGHRIVRRRRLVAVGGVAAFSAVVAVGVSALGALDRAAELRPGVSTPARGTASATIELSGPRVVGGIDATRFVVRIGPGAMPPLDGAPSSGADLAYYALVDGREQLLGGSSTNGLTGRATFGHADGTDVAIGVVPGDAVDASLLGDGTSSGHSASPLVRVPGTAFKAIAFRFNEIPADSSDIRPIWWRADGTPVTNDGAGSVVRFASAEGDVDLWALPAADLVGQRTAGGGGTTLLSHLFAEGVADLDATRDYVWDERETPAVVKADPVHLYVIPGRASDVRGTYSPKVLHWSAIQTRYWLAIDATVALARAELPETPATRGGTIPLLSRLTWTDAKGAAQSQDFR
jgi:hypothetical protein